MLTIVRVILPIPALAALSLLLVVSSGVGCSSQYTSLPPSLVQPAKPPSATAAAPASTVTVEAPDQLGAESQQTAALTQNTESPTPAATVAKSPPFVASRSELPLAAPQNVLFYPQVVSSVVPQSDLSRKVQLAVDRFINSLFRMDGMTWLGWAIIVAMVFFYTLENRSPFFILAFATAAWAAAAYGYLRGSWQVAAVGGIWGCLAVRKCWRDIKVKNSGVRKPERLLAVWHIRFVGILAVISGLVLLVVDSPLAVHLPTLIGRSVAESVPLLLVGIAYLAWLAVDRPAVIDLVKQGLIAIAFILWGITLLMPTGQWSRFIGAVVIALYVFDLAWLMEGNLRKTIRAAGTTGECTSPHCESAGVCRCNGVLSKAATARAVTGE